MAGELYFLAATTSGALLTGIGAGLVLLSLGYAFSEDCSSPQAQAIGYTGCFSWGQWLQSIAIIVFAFAYVGFAESAALSAMRHAQECSRQSMWALAFLLTSAVLATLFAILWLAKPWATYQTYPDGRTKEESKWTVDVWLTFLGYCIIAVVGPLSVALLLVTRNVAQRPDFTSMSNEDVENRSESSSNNGSSDGSYSMSTPASARNLVCRGKAASRSLTKQLVAVAVLLLCFLITTVGTPIWNYSMNSYFKSVSKYALAYLPIGELPCSLQTGKDSCSCGKDIYHWLPDFEAGVDPCPWFTFKPFPDTVLFYGFLITCLICGAAMGSAKWSRSKLHVSKFLPELNLFPNGISVLEALAACSTVALFIAWFCYWEWGYSRFHELDATHDCWTSEARNVSDKIGTKGEPGVAVTLNGSQLHCDEISGSDLSGHAQLHIFCRVTGHMSSVAFALTMLPVPKRSVLLDALGLSYERVMHWHRRLGTASYMFVTLHMLCWWLKWILDGTFVKNLIAIDTQKWVWVTPSWNHYENFSVLMAQVAWIFFTLVIAIALSCRRRRYRLFYVAHQLTLVFLFIGVAHAWSFWFFALPGLALWWLDRLSRLVMASYPTCVKRFSAVPGTDVTHVELWAHAVASKFTAGQFCLINVPSVCKSSWHPFTVNVSGDGVTFLCKADGSWTQKLRSEASKQGEDARPPVALCIGPYGSLNPSDYSEGPLFLAAGGIGITPVIAVFKEALNRGVPGVTLLWSIRSPDYLHLPFVNDTLNAARNDENVNVIIHATQAKIEDLPDSSGNVSYRPGRPNIREYMETAATRGKGLQSGFAFACGPRPLQDEVMKISQELGFGKTHVETFLF